MALWGTGGRLTRGTCSATGTSFVARAERRAFAAVGAALHALLERDADLIAEVGIAAVEGERVERGTHLLARVGAGACRLSRGEADWGNTLAAVFLDPTLDLVGKYGLNRSRLFMKPGLTMRLFVLMTRRSDEPSTASIMTVSSTLWQVIAHDMMTVRTARLENWGRAR